jgi:hypothetical protein
VEGVVDAAAYDAEGVAELGWAVGLIGGKQRRQDPLAELGVEDREPLAVVGEHVAVAVIEAADEPVQAQPAQVVGHLAGAVGAAEQAGDKGAKAPIGYAGDGMQRQAQGAGQGHDAKVPEAQGSGPLALPCVGLLDPLEGGGPDGTALAGTLDLQDTPVGGAGLGDQRGQVRQAAADAEVVGGVHDGLDPQRPAVLEVLQPGGIRADGESVGQRGKADLGLGGLPLAHSCPLIQHLPG